jgi:hypothetical protein
MVPFSFPQPLLKSRVIMSQLMVESLELRAASVTVDDRHQDPIGGTAREDFRPTKGGSAPVANLPFLKHENYQTNPI